MDIKEQEIRNKVADEIDGNRSNMFATYDNFDLLSGQITAMFPKGPDRANALICMHIAFNTACHLLAKELRSEPTKSD